jgi:hypothetical protein
VTTAKLVGTDTDPAGKLASAQGSARDLYRFDDEAPSAAEQLRCLTCAGAAGAGNGPFEVEISPREINGRQPSGERGQAASDDGTVAAFASEERLLEADRNEAHDVYAWLAVGSGECSEASAEPGLAYFPAAAGCLQLISGGAEGRGVYGSSTSAQEDSLKESGVSPDGKSIFFVTAGQLVQSDGNQALDLYAARVGGGFAAIEPAERCAQADTCQGPVEAPPGSPAPASSNFTGPGNPVAPKRCKKGFVRKKGKCVKKGKQGKPGKKSKKGKKHRKQATNNQGDRR